MGIHYHLTSLRIEMHSLNRHSMKEYIFLAKIDESINLPTRGVINSFEIVSGFGKESKIKNKSFFL